MKSHQHIIESLEKLRRAEFRTGEYYLGASKEAEQRGNSQTAELYRSLRDIHGSLALMFEERKDELEDMDGEGIFGETMQAFANALRSAVSDLPVLFIEGETHPSPQIFVKYEQELIAHYRTLLDKADPETQAILERAIRSGEKSIELIEGKG